jgi:hypothetical protein
MKISLNRLDALGYVKKQAEGYDIRFFDSLRGPC